MSETLVRVQELVSVGEFRPSLHGFRKLAADDILLDDIISSIGSAILVEDYPDAVRGPSVLVLQLDSAGRPIHVVWGLPRGHETPAVLITAYRPDPRRWSSDLMRRESHD